MVLVRRASRLILRSSRLQTTVIFFSRIIFISFTDMSLQIMTKFGLIFSSFCSRIQSLWPSTSILVFKSGMIKLEFLPASQSNARKRRILGLTRVVCMRLLAMLLLITIPLIQADFELSFQSIIFTLMHSLMSIESPNIREDGLTCSTAFMTNSVSIFSHLSALNSFKKSCSQTTFSMWRLEQSKRRPALETLFGAISDVLNGSSLIDKSA